MNRTYLSLLLYWLIWCLLHWTKMCRQFLLLTLLVVMRVTSWKIEPFCMNGSRCGETDNYGYAKWRVGYAKFSYVGVRYLTGFIAVTEMSGRNKISQCQGIVRKFYSVREILTFGKLDEKRNGISHNVRENDYFRQHDAPVSTYIDRLAKLRLKIFSISTFSNSLIMYFKIVFEPCLHNQMIKLCCYVIWFYRPPEESQWLLGWLQVNYSCWLPEGCMVDRIT